MIVEFSNLNDESGVYSITSSKNGKVSYAKFTKGVDGRPDSWVHIEPDGNIVSIVNPPNKSVWIIENVEKIVLHPNMTLKGVPAINTD